MRRGTRRSPALLATLMLVISMVFAVGGTGQAASPVSGSQEEQSAATLRAGDSIWLPNGLKRVLPKDWSRMSLSDLAKIGVVPGLSVSPARAVALGVQLVNGSAGNSTSSGFIATRLSTRRLVTPMNADRCSTDVCINVGGGNGNVFSWSTRGLWRTGPGDTFSAYWDGPAIIDTGTIVHATGPGLVYGYFTHVPFHVKSPHQLCNTWVGIAGKPCITAY